MTENKDHIPKVLVVDNDERNLLFLKILLLELKAVLIKVHSLKEALDILAEHDFALVILDTQIPDMSDPEVSELMRSKNFFEEVPILLVTAMNKENSYVIKGHEISVADYLFKPIDMSVLKGKVSIFLENYSHRRQIKCLRAKLASAKTSLKNSCKEQSELQGTRGEETFHYCESEKSCHRYTLIEEGIKQGLKNQDFYLVYQPIVDLLTANIVAVEALCRCKTPALSNVSPEEFITVAEEYGLMPTLGKWVFCQVLSDVEKFIFPANKDIGVHINLSPKQLSEDSFIDLVEEIFKNKTINPRQFTFELTETSVMSDVALLEKQLVRINNMGCRISIDDFGTGYSSMSWLRSLPISSLKIDKTFISDVTQNKNDEIITKSIIQLAKNLELTAIAEGVETEEQRHFLVEHHCLLAQGYYFAKPVKVDAFIKMLKVGKCADF